MSIPLNYERLGQMVANLPAIAVTFGWSSPTGIVPAYLDVDGDPEAEFVRDLLLTCLPDPATKVEAWARLTDRVEHEGRLDDIAAAMTLEAAA